MFYRRTFSPSVLLSNTNTLKEDWSSPPSLQSLPCRTKPISLLFSWWAANWVTSSSWNWQTHTTEMLLLSMSGFSERSLINTSTLTLILVTCVCGSINLLTDTNSWASCTNADLWNRGEPGDAPDAATGDHQVGFGGFEDVVNCTSGENLPHGFIDHFLCVTGPNGHRTQEPHGKHLLQERIWDIWHKIQKHFFYK